MTASEQIKVLRDLGYKVHVGHYRPLAGMLRGAQFAKFELEIEREDDPSLRFHEKGGLTEVSIRTDGGEILGEGSAACSYGDNFEYKVGLELAFDRAILDAFAGQAPVRPLQGETGPVRVDITKPRRGAK